MSTGNDVESMVHQIEEADTYLAEIDGHIATWTAKRNELLTSRQKLVETVAQMARELNTPVVMPAQVPPEPVKVPVQDSWFQSPTEMTSFLPAVSRFDYVSRVVHVLSIPSTHSTYIRMNNGRFEVHLLPRLTGVAVQQPADARSACGVRSTGTGVGNSRWEAAQIQYGVISAEVCSSCVEQLEQAKSNTRQTT